MTSSDRATPNLPSADFDRTVGFYEKLGFRVEFRDDGWMILSRGTLEVEFFPLRQDPRRSCFSACFRVADLGRLYEAFGRAGLSGDRHRIPRLTPPEQHPGNLRIFALVDPDGSLIRCIEEER